MTYAEEKVSGLDATFGMWVFLSSELLFFGGIFLTLAVYRHLYPAAFTAGTRHLGLVLGGINTAVLLTSSTCLAVGIETRHQLRRLQMLWSTLFLGIIFLVIKGIEYHEHYTEGLFPILNWNLALYPDPHLLLFFVLYFCITLLHAFHLVLGLSLIAWLIFKGRESRWFADHEAFVANCGLYWHFVDVIWVFVFPLLYLIGRT